MNLGFIVLIAVAVLVLSPLSRILLAVCFGRAIGRAALARQPDTIVLEPSDRALLKDAARVEAVAAEFQRHGFESAGVFSINEMPGVNVELLAHHGESMAGAIYDHPVAGVFYDVVSRYEDGACFTYTTARATGLKSPPDKRMVHLPGAEPATLIKRAWSERPKQGLRACATSSVVSDFVTAYAETMAWMKRRGVSTAEVVSVARRKVA